MLLLGDSEHRTRSHDMVLGGTTAITAGMVNVASVMAFFGFSSNVTGHVAVFTEELSKGRWHQVAVVVGWLTCFLMGALLANVLVRGLPRAQRMVGRVAAPALEVGLLLAVGYYCHAHYAETLRETEQLIGVLLFAMGLQNGMVASVSRGVVKTTHLTGLFTDLGIELAMAARGDLATNDVLGFKLRLHLTILVGYLTGGILGGAVFLRFGYLSLGLAASVLASILLHDLVIARRRHLADRRTRDGSGGSSASWGAGAAPSPDRASRTR